MPQKIHTDNELAILNAIKVHFPETTLVTCIFHIKNNWKKFLNDKGLKNQIKLLNSYIKTIFVLLLCNQACPKQHEFAKKNFNGQT